MQSTSELRAESLLAGQARVLESVATGAPLADVLQQLAGLIEAQDEGLLCSILVLDEEGGSFELGVGPSLPDGYIGAILGRPIALCGGPCQMAAHRGEAVVAPDLRADTRWSQRWCELASSRRLLACSSTPIIAPGGKALGSFAMYRREPGDPRPADSQLTRVATHLAGIAIQRARADRALSDSQSRLGRELAAMQRLHELVARLHDCRDLRTALDEVLGATIAIVGSDMGNVQLYDPARQVLEIVAQRGFKKDFLEHFRSVQVDSGTACGRALMDGERVVIEDVQTDPGHLPHLHIAISAGWHGVQSTPLLGRNREVLGMLSTHYKRAHRPSERDLRMLDLYARQAADFIERRRAEERLAALNDNVARRAEELQTLLDLLPAGIFIAQDAACTSITMNAAGAAILGIAAGANASKTGPEGAQLPFRVLRNGVEIPGQDLPMQRAARTGVAVCGDELQVVRADGSAIMLYEYASPLFDALGQVRGCVGVFIDITARKQAEEALRASEERFRRMADSMPQVVFAAQPDGKVSYVNRYARESTGLHDALLHDGWARCIHPDDRERVLGSWRRAVESGSPYEAECRFRLADGSYRWLLTRGLPVRDRDGRLIEWVGGSADVHELKAAKEALQDSDRRKDEFLSILAHELRNPLAPLRNGLQVMRLAKHNGEVVEQARTMMERQLGHMVRLVDDLLDLGRISRGRIEVKKERVELARVLHAAVETSRPLIEHGEHRLVLELPEAPVYVDADVTRLAQVFANLLNNAAKYTERGGRIRLAARQDGGQVVVSVADSGVGIPAHMLPKVFEMFTQVDRSLERSQGGLGIGLTLVKRLVDLHGGTVEAKSGGHGMGSEFMVRLPVVLSVVREPVPARDAAGAAPARRRVLVVDDNRDAALSLALMLNLMGNDTQTAHDGIEALDVAAAYRPDAMLLDIGMPRLNGYETARRIREEPWGRRILLVALTGWGQEEDKRHSREAGFDRHLTKPVEPAALEELFCSTGAQAEEARA